MLNNTYEWYRMVNVQPNDETIEKRKAAVADLIKVLTKSSALLVNSVSAVVKGFENTYSQDSELVQAVVKSIRDHQPAFPENLAENSLELRACTAIALGEIIGRHVEGDKNPDGNAQMVSSLIVSALGMRPKNKNRYTQIVLDELAVAAFSTMEKAARIIRQRQDLSFKNIDKVATNDLPTFWTQFQPALKAYLASLQKQAELDREELDILWWLYNGLCETENKPIGELAIGIAAVYCGVELAEKVSTPPLSGVREMVIQTIKKGGRKTELTSQPLNKIVTSWNDRVWSRLIPQDVDVQKALKENPVVYPLSWLCMRLQESKGTAGWNHEFKLKTGINPTQSIELDQLALQAFNEIIAQKSVE